LSRITLPHPPLAISGSEDAFWPGGTSAYVAKGRVEQTSTFSLSAGLNQQNQFAISGSVPAPGNYTILSSPTVTNTSWQTVAVLTSVSTRLDWADTNVVQGARFYRVRQDNP
jgi:hypothetical protein